MLRSRRNFIGTLGYVGGSLLSGCYRKPRGTAQKVIAFSNANNAEPYRAAQLALLRRLVSQHSDLRLVVADAQQDSDRQTAQVDTFIRQRPDILIVAPNERSALTQAMGDAMDAHIPVICLERDIVKPNYTTYVRADNAEIGRMVGQFLVANLRQRYGVARGNVVFLRGLLGVEAEINRDHGAREVLAGHPDIHIIADPVANWNQAEGKDRMTEVLRVNQKIDAVYGHNDPMAVGGYLAARDLGREHEMIFVGIDGLGGPAGGIKKVVDGILQATFIYPLAVDKAFDLSVQMLHDPSFRPAKIYTMPSTMVTAENAVALYEKTTANMSS
jgi:ribose transport system substrate-binding protein